MESTYERMDANEIPLLVMPNLGFQSEKLMKYQYLPEDARKVSLRSRRAKFDNRKREPKYVV